MALGFYDKANKIFNKAIETNPKYVSSYNNLGRCFDLQNNLIVVDGLGTEDAVFSRLQDVIDGAISGN